VLRAPRAGWIAVALLAAFAFWSGVTLLWSVAPDQTWIECNRAITDLVVLGLAIGLGASHPRVPRLVADGFAIVALLVSAYALGQKLLAGRRGLALDPTGPLAATVAQRTVLAVTPPAGSATSAPTVGVGRG
jgi:hypothetical protein